MKNKLAIFSLITWALSLPVFAANPALHYEPETVALTGVIKIEKYPAPPKNEAIGDKEEIYRYLVLDHPIDVVPQKSDSIKKNELQKNIKEVQIVRIEDYYKAYNAKCGYYYEQNQLSKNKKLNNQCPYSNWSDEFINKHVRITGTLYSRIVRVVMIANHFEIIK